MGNQERRLYCSKCSYTKIYKSKEKKPKKCPKCGKIVTYYQIRGFNLQEHIINTIRHYVGMVEDFLCWFFASIICVALFGLFCYGSIKILKFGVVYIAEVIKHIF